MYLSLKLGRWRKETLTGDRTQGRSQIRGPTGISDPRSRPFQTVQLLLALLSHRSATAQRQLSLKAAGGVQRSAGVSKSSAGVSKKSSPGVRRICCADAVGSEKFETPAELAAYAMHT
jgi:hypothetical protein